MHRWIRSGGASIAAFLLATPPAATGQTVQYGYDAAGRLSVVADPHGDLAVYDYDAVGNLLSIRRIRVSDVPDTVLIAHVAPGVAAPAASVSIFGKGFGPAPESNAVTFNGVPAVVLTASATRLTVRVPPNATTGPIQLIAPLGVATSKPFRILGSFSVAPATAVVAPQGSVRFVASGDGAADVRWSVDGVAGGDAQRGRITSGGVYVAPAQLPAGGVRVTATSVVDPALEATAHVSVIASRSLFLAAEPLAVGSRPSRPSAGVTAVASVGIRTTTVFGMAAPLALRVAPVILTVAPGSAARGASIRVVVTGAGFEGATRLEFWTATGVDPSLSVMALAISADGSEAAADVAIHSDAGVGPRIVRIVTPSGSSGGAVPGENLFMVAE